MKRVATGRNVLRWGAILLAGFSVSAVACSDTPSDGDDAGLDPDRDSGTQTGASSGTPNDEFAEPPSLAAIEPARATVGSIGPTLLVTGRGFVARTVVQLDGEALETSFISPTELRATMPTDKLSAPGTLELSVGTAPPGGGASQALSFVVENPSPTLTRVSRPSPPSVLANHGADLVMELEGAGFVDGATVRWQGEALATTWVSAGKLSAVVPASKLVDSGVYSIDVENPAPGGGLSASLAFTVANPNVSIASLTPAQTTVGTSSITLTVTGENFIAGKTMVLFNSELVDATVNSETELSVTIPGSRLTEVCDCTIVVQNPDPGGGTSLPRIFRIVNPVPRPVSMSPSGVLAGSPATPITITGERFVPSSQVRVDGEAVATTYVSATELKITIVASNLQTAKVLPIRVENPGPGGGTATIDFQVRNTGPVIDQVLPAYTVDDGDGFQIGKPVNVVVKGANFVPDSKVVLNGTEYPGTVFGNASQLTVTVTPGVAAMAFQVRSPNPGGTLTSNTVNLTACTASTVESLPQADGGWWTYNLASHWSSSPPTARRFTTSGTCPVSLSSTVTPYVAMSVRNTSGRAAVLEAWAVCGRSTDDAFLAIYPSTLNMSSDASRQQCTGAASNGRSGHAGYESLDNQGNSSWCPGLSSGAGAVPIAACETKVVYMQPYTATATSQPGGITIGLWPQ